MAETFFFVDDIVARIDKVCKDSRESSDIATSRFPKVSLAVANGIDIRTIAKEDPHVSRVLEIFDRAKLLGREVIERANMERGACVELFFSEKALDIMKDFGIIPALITIPEDSKWGTQSIKLLELLDPTKDTIRTQFKANMSKSLLKLFPGKCCRMCFWQRKTLSHCSVCKNTFYCSKACQKADWSRHKKKDCNIKI
jgi:hypothetical protein